MILSSLEKSTMPSKHITQSVRMAADALLKGMAIGVLKDCRFSSCQIQQLLDFTGRTCFCIVGARFLARSRVAATIAAKHDSCSTCAQKSVFPTTPHLFICQFTSKYAIVIANEGANSKNTKHSSPQSADDENKITKSEHVSCTQACEQIHKIHAEYNSHPLTVLPSLTDTKSHNY